LKPLRLLVAAARIVARMVWIADGPGGLDS
jgi:hypothetical protein